MIGGDPDSMIILEDTRQQINKHDLKHKWFEENGVTIKRCRLYAGDYTLPTNQSICIDTKKDLQELCGNVTQQHERFKRELIRAMEAGIQIVFLVEHGPDVKTLEDVYFWQNPRKHEIRWRYNKVTGQKEKYFISPKAIDGKQLYKSLCTIRDRYGANFCFCSKEETGQKIVEILNNGKATGI